MLCIYFLYSGSSLATNMVLNRVKYEVCGCVTGHISTLFYSWPVLPHQSGLPYCTIVPNPERWVLSCASLSRHMCIFLNRCQCCHRAMLHTRKRYLSFDIRELPRQPWLASLAMFDGGKREHVTCLHWEHDQICSFGVQATDSCGIGGFDLPTDWHSFKEYLTNLRLFKSQNVLFLQSDQ